MPYLADGETEAWRGDTRQVMSVEPVNGRGRIWTKDPVALKCTFAIFEYQEEGME